MVEVTHHIKPDHSKYPEADGVFEGEGGAYASYCLIQHAGGTNMMDIFHTFTPESMRGKGIAEVVVKAAFAHARENGWMVAASCSYVAGTFLSKNPELASLVVEDPVGFTM